MPRQNNNTSSSTSGSAKPKARRRRQRQAPRLSSDAASSADDGIYAPARHLRLRASDENSNKLRAVSARLPPDPPPPCLAPSRDFLADLAAVLVFMGAILFFLAVVPVLIVAAVLVLHAQWTLPVVFAYAVYVRLFDWCSPVRGGWRDTASLLGRTITDSPLWRFYRRYFSATLVRTAPLPPSRNYIFCAHPHGVYCLGHFANIITNRAHFQDLFPGIVVKSATLPVNFWIPIWREVMLAIGFVSCERAAIQAVLARPTFSPSFSLDFGFRERKTSNDGIPRRDSGVDCRDPWILKETLDSESTSSCDTGGSGKALFLAIGGAEEFMLMQPGTMDLVVKKRKGFARVAIETGPARGPGVPVGATHNGTPLGPPGARALSSTTRRLARFAVPIITGRWGTPFPRRGVRLVTVIGAPIHPPPLAAGESLRHEDVDLLHARYLEALKELYEQHKDTYFAHRVKDMEFVQ
ncbi:Diacylglycerol O-acyltransferase 2-like protein 6 [Entophlyctis sp. JEL0112]|nr:Diacylglycerol O-acyltransferase 2-like protein 6 [Entophlyctis sp. JEL0112]